MGADTRELLARLEWAVNTICAHRGWGCGCGRLANRVQDRWWAWAVRTGRVVVTAGDGYRVCAVRG